MAKYCRYCGRKMSAPRDNFCYECHKEGKPVGFTARFADKVKISEDDKDIIWEYAELLFFGPVILSVLPLIFLIWGSALIVSGASGKPSPILMALLVIFLLFLVFIAVSGAQLMLLKKAAVSRKWKISLIMFFCALTRSSRSGAAMISAALTSKRKRMREQSLRNALINLSECEKGSLEPSKGNGRGEPSEKNRTCGFCGYENPRSRTDCKSCGKNR
ncbi:MAG: hypothetical protein NC394_07475 [Bacteroides sp.]|nr:hypothetical protein [Bacteroides sp.]